jgi:cobalt-zinc-cadmium efflux system membrane fusion protein
MGKSVKLLIAWAAVVLVALVAYRELRPGAAPQKYDAHGHGPAAADKGKVAAKKDEHGHSHADEHGEQGEGFIKLSAAQVDTAGIEMAPAASGALVKEIAVPGRITTNADRQAKIVPKLAGTVAKVLKRFGETVAENELLAVLESREMADTKADYLAAWRAEELASSIFVREERLWKQKVIAEQDFLSARNAKQTAKIKLDQARQKLHTVGLSAEEIDAVLSNKDETKLRHYEMRSPMAGRVTSRSLLLGQFVGTEKEVFTIADLSTVWIELAIAPSDFSFAKEGQEVRVQSGARKGSGKIIALSPVIDPDTRSAKAVAEVDNASGEWKVGDFATAQLISASQEVDLVVPRDAVQTIKGVKAVFVSQGGGFKMRPITTGRHDSVNVEVLSGLEFGETIAVKNTFVLKAELGKAEAEHQH